MIYIKTPNQLPNEWLHLSIEAFSFSEKTGTGSIKVKGIVQANVTTEIHIKEFEKMLWGHTVDSLHGYFKCKFDKESTQFIDIINLWKKETTKKDAHT